MPMGRINGQAVRAWREMCLFTRDGLAMHAEVEGGGAVIAAIERGAIVPDPATIVALARALGVNEDELAGTDEPEEPEGA